jgi:site-specific DNA recombinase
MKNVLIYSRACTNEQAKNGFNLEFQNKKLLGFCKKNGWNVLETFDEDYTAWKGFNRPAYNQLSSYIKKSKTKVDMVLFTQWSRFSRDYTHAVNEIERLQKLGIEVNAIEQWMDLTIQENHFLLPIYLCNENIKISNN